MTKSKQMFEAGRRARVLVVDDSTVMRRLVAHALEGDPYLEIVGTARNGREALERLAALAPDVVTMDIEMPEMDGLEALRHIRRLSPQVRVVMLSALTERGAAVTLEALSLGADDYVTKLPGGGKSLDESTARLRDELVPKVRQFFTFSPAEADAEIRRPAPVPAILQSLEPKPAVRFVPPACVPRVVAIGVSTGGPSALAKILPDVPRDFSLPILIVQHMPRLFTKLLGERLQERTHLPVREAVHGEVVPAGVMLIAPGDYHMRLELASGERQPKIVLDQSPPENSCRPSVDVLLESLAQVYGGAVIAAILTGMGQDGLRGAKLLKSAGATILAQDEETSAVWGMPRAVVDAKIADAVLPLGEVVPYILRECERPFRGYKSVAREMR